MTTPAAVISGNGKLSLKNILVTTIVAIVVILIVQKAMRQTIVLTDPATGGTINGEIKTSLNLPKRA